MRETLLLRQNASDAARFAWRYFSDDAPTGRSGEGTLEEVAEKFAKARLILLVPSDAVLITRVSLPIRQSSKLLQAVPYALEERLSEDVDTLHFALGARQDNGETPVAVTRQVQMEHWLQPFETHALRLDSMLPDFLALPWVEDQLSLAMTPDRVVVRHGAFDGFSTQPELLSEFLGNDLDQPIRLYRQDGSAGLPIDANLVHSESMHELIELATPTHLRAAAFNLLQGGFAPDHASAQWSKHMKWPAALAASWVLLSTLSLALSNASHQNKLDALYAESESVFREAFPEQTRIVNMEHQARQALSALLSSGQGDGLLPLLSASTPHLNKVDKLRLDSLQYRDGSLYLSLSGSDLQALERLRGEFAENKTLKLDVQSAQAGTEGVQIRLKVDMV